MTVAPAEPTIEGEVAETESRELVRAAPAVLAVTPQVQASELVERLAMIREASETAMQEGVDFGVIPGTNKPALLKPGAEKLSVLFQLDVQLENEKQWGPGDHLTVESKATVYHAPTGARLGFGEGLCTTREKKYAKRRADRACPDCGKANIRRSKNAGEGFYCWRKTDGCGATFPPDDDRITSQVEGDIDNPDLPDLWNTVVKMAEKRARVDAVLAVTGASALFTQDIEDGAEVEREQEAKQEAKPPAVRTVTGEQAQALNDAAMTAALTAGQYWDAILVGCGQQTERLGEDDALARIRSALPRVPAEYVPAILDVIRGTPA